jgi:hypothetical protein
MSYEYEEVEEVMRQYFELKDAVNKLLPREKEEKSRLKKEYEIRKDWIARHYPERVSTSQSLLQRAAKKRGVKGIPFTLRQFLIDNLDNGVLIENTLTPRNKDNCRNAEKIEDNNVEEGVSERKMQDLNIGNDMSGVEKEGFDSESWRWERLKEDPWVHSNSPMCSLSEDGLEYFWHTGPGKMECE